MWRLGSVILVITYSFNFLDTCIGACLRDWPFSNTKLVTELGETL